MSLAAVRNLIIIIAIVSLCVIGCTNGTLRLNTNTVTGVVLNTNVMSINGNELLNVSIDDNSGAILVFAFWNPHEFDLEIGEKYRLVYGGLDLIGGMSAYTLISAEKTRF